jgi:5-carboxymethyl-2-hydroxymuconate isomerase
MPQLILEFSDNIIEQNDLSRLMKTCNEALVVGLPAELASCKTRAIKHSLYHLGDGNPSNAFVHANLKVMPGRTNEVLQNMGNNIMEILKAYFVESQQKLNLQITIEIGELQNIYFKFMS